VCGPLFGAGLLTTVLNIFCRRNPLVTTDLERIIRSLLSERFSIKEIAVQSSEGEISRFIKGFLSAPKVFTAVVCVQ
jgi:hypothetical protein